MKFCSGCGSPVIQHVPEGEDRLRYVCPSCQTIHYQNPKVVTGVIATMQGKLLLCRRAIEPRAGYWTIPAGYLENGETIEEGARREAWEEARAQLGPLRPFRSIDIPHIHQIYFLFLGELISPEVEPGPESREVEMIPPDQIPWDDLAFKVVKMALRSWLDDPLDEGFKMLELHAPKAGHHHPTAKTLDER